MVPRQLPFGSPVAGSLLPHPILPCYPLVEMAPTLLHLRHPTFDRSDSLSEGKPRKKGARFTLDDQLNILRGKANGWSNRRIASALPASGAGVREYWKRMLNDPALIFGLPVLVEVSKNTYRCELCSGKCPGWRDGVRHLLFHLLPTDIAMQVPLKLIRKPL